MSLKESNIIEKLNANNYSTWRFKVEMLLIKEDLFSVITDTPPDPITDDWRKRDNKARAIINLFIEDSEIINIKHLETAKATFETLQNIHERKNLSSKLFLLRKLYNTKLEENDNMITHINSILEIVDKLHAIGEEISDHHVSALLLCSLPKSYDTLVTALEARPEQELNSSFIRSKLTDEYNRRVDQYRVTQNSARAFQASRATLKYDNYNANNHKQNNLTNNYQKRENKFCTYCKKKSHYKSDCWYLKKKTNNSNAKNKTNTALCFETEKINKIEDTSPEACAKEIENIITQTNEFALITKESSNKWIIDSGSSSHISNNIDLFTEINNNNTSEVIIANGQTLTAYGSGDITFSINASDSQTNKIILKNVLFVPEIKTNLISVKRATQNGCIVKFDKNSCSFSQDGKICFTGRINENNLYEINFDIPKPYVQANIVNSCKGDNCIKLWHARLGHRNNDAIKEIMKKQLATGIEINNCHHGELCEICTKSKLSDKPYPKQATNRANKILQLIHSDICGPIKTPTIGGKKYILTFIDDHSRYTTIYLLSQKSEVYEKFKEFVNEMKNKFGKTPQALRSDNAGEYLSHDMENFMKQNGIKRQLSIPYSSQQNGVAERKNRSLIEMTRCLLNQANLEQKFWGEAVNTAVYLQNRLPTKSNDKTPFEIWENKKPDLSHIKLFGCKAYMYVNKQKRSKLDDAAIPGIFVGYDSNSKGYRIYTGGKNITISRQVKFFENINTLETSINQENINFECDSTNREIQNNKIEIDLSSPPPDATIETPDPGYQMPRRSERSNKGVPPDRLIYFANQYIEEPKTWDDIENMENPIEKSNWLKATQEEIDALKQNKTWTLVEPPQGKRVIGSKWTFKSKYNSEGKIEKFKARLVAKGFSQKFGEDFDETYAAVVSHTTIRALLAAAVHKNLNVHHVDVKTAFLHGNLDEDVYMAQPEGYIVPGKEHLVCKLDKAIYGLKQAARAWQTKISQTLTDLNFTQSKADACLYYKKTKENTIYIVVYVDDILIVGNDSQIKQTITNLRKQYEIKDLGPIRYYLGINVRKNEKGQYLLNQSTKIKEIINKFNLNDSKPCDTPIEPGYIKDEGEENPLPNNKKYRQAIGALLYVATITRPDILAAVNILSRKNEKPREKDWQQVKRVIRYLKTTQDLELIIDPGKDAELTCYSDSDWAGDKSDRKSTSGNLFFLGNSPINWISKKQNCVALSSAEAEYIAAANAAQEILWMLRLLDDLDMKQQLPVKLFQDNQSTIKMMDSGKHQSRTKHVDIKFHCIRDLKQKEIIDVNYCPSDHMIADILTKPLPKSSFSKHRNRMLAQSARPTAFSGQGGMLEEYHRTVTADRAKQTAPFLRAS